MIGIPRITLIRPALSPDSARTPDTRINAQNSPRTVDRISEPMVTRIVSHTPCSRIGRNSVASRRKFCIDSNHALHPARSKLNHGKPMTVSPGHMSGGLRLESPFVENLVDGAIRLELGERGVDLLEQFGIGLADADADLTGDGRFVGFNQANLRKAALLEVVGEDRVVGETGLEAARVHVAQDVRNGVVHLDLTEQSRLLQGIDKGGANLRPDGLALQIFQPGV